MIIPEGIWPSLYSGLLDLLALNSCGPVGPVAPAGPVTSVGSVGPCSLTGLLTHQPLSHQHHGEIQASAVAT